MLNRRILVISWVIMVGLVLTAYELFHTRHIPAPLAIAPPSSIQPQQPISETTPICQHLYQLICQKKGAFRDPTGIVHKDAEGELQALRTYEEIIHQHSDWNSDQVDEELVKIIYTSKRRERVKAAFRIVERKIENFINRQPNSVFSPNEKRQLKKRLRKTQLQLPPPAAIYSDEPDLFTKNDVYYERTLEGEMRLRVGGAYLLTVKSWFNLIFTLAHEMAHSIDPCEIRSARLSLPAYDRLYGCFLRQGLVATRKTRSECGENDQLSETFADWVAVQITSEALESFASEFHGTHLLNAVANSVKDLCEQEENFNDSDLEYHPSPQVRIEFIFGRNPKIRNVLGCDPPLDGAEYCNFESSSL